MDAIAGLVHAIYETPFSTSIRESEWTFPIIQTFHILGILVFFGAIAIVDLVLIGVPLVRRPALEVSRTLLPVTWIGFAIMAASGGVLLIAQAEKIYTNIFLLSKFGLIALAGVNILLFHATAYRSIENWGAGETSRAPASARAAAILSLLAWAAVIVTGRFIAYY